MGIINASKAISGLLEGKPFHLVFYQLMERSARPPRVAVYHELGDTIRNITSGISEEYQSIDVTDNQESIFGFTGRAQILKEDESPLLIEGSEVYLSYDRPDEDGVGNKSGVLIFVLNNDVLEPTFNSFYSTIPPYWEFSYLFNAVYRK